MGDEACDYWDEEKHQFPVAQAQHIDWSAMERAAKSLPFQICIWLAKMLSGVIGVNQWKKKWGQSLHDECPVCLRPNESATHVIHCPDDRVNDQWMRSLSKLALYLEKIHTPDDMTTTPPHRGRENQ